MVTAGGHALFLKVENFRILLFQALCMFGTAT